MIPDCNPAVDTTGTLYCPGCTEILENIQSFPEEERALIRLRAVAHTSYLAWANASRVRNAHADARSTEKAVSAAMSTALSADRHLAAAARTYAESLAKAALAPAPAPTPVQIDPPIRPGDIVDFHFRDNCDSKTRPAIVVLVRNPVAGILGLHVLFAPTDFFLAGQPQNGSFCDSIEMRPAGSDRSWTWSRREA